MDNALTDSKYLTALAPAAAGTGTSNGNVIDTAGYDACEFVTSIGTIVATGTVDVKIQQGAAADLSDAADLEGTKISYTDADDTKLAVHDIIRPQERYLRVVVVRATANGTINLSLARLYQAKNKPTTQASASVVGAEVHLSPPEGTA